MRRLVAIGLVWLGSCLAWMILGSTLLSRSGASWHSLGPEVHALWGPPIVQQPPQAVETEAPQGEPALELQPSASDLSVALQLEHRRKGLLWFPTYTVDFDASYAFENPADQPKTLSLSFPLESENALYDGFEVLDSAGRPAGALVERGVARWSAEIPARGRASYRVKYRSRGIERWQYQLTAGTGQVKDFRLVLETDFDKVDFSAGTLSPTSQASAGGGWQGEWKFKTLVASSPIGIDLPERINPGPLAAKITFFAPISLLFFFFVVAILAHARKVELHAMHYFFLACAFFAFHLLFSYLVDHLAIAPAFALASAVSVGLVVSYARLFVGWRFALREIGVSQLLYLVLFSFSFFWPGFTGLSITIGAILTLAMMMQLTGRTQWGRAVPTRGRACAAPYRCGLEPTADSAEPTQGQESELAHSS
jgi:hypothetical protein